jgi:hypothetical protein
VLVAALPQFGRSDASSSGVSIAASDVMSLMVGWNPDANSSVQRRKKASRRFRRHTP